MDSLPKGEEKKKMSSKRKRGIVYLILIVVLLSAISSCNLKTSITGFAVLDENATSNETIAEDVANTADTTSETAINETQEPKEKPEKEAKEEKIDEEKEKPEEKPEKTGPNNPPVWKSDISEFTIKGTTVIDLNSYFIDDNNDTITYTSTTPEKILVAIDSSFVTLSPLESNFTATIEFTASDGDKSTAKEVNLVVPEKTITINLQYRPGTGYDPNDDGSEPTTGIVDLSVENSQFSWSVNETNLCTRWEVYSVEDEDITTVCYGAEKCCGFIGLGATRDSWKEDFYAAFGQYGSSLNNIVSSQVIYVDYGKKDDKPYAEIYYSEWKNLSANYYFAEIDFENVCVETCILEGFNDTSYKLIFEIENAVLNFDLLTYSIIEEISRVPASLSVKDDGGIESGIYQMYKEYKDNVSAAIEEGFVEPDYYDIEIVPTQNVIDKLVIENANMTKPLAATIGIDNVTREISIENVDVKKRYAVDLGQLEFEKATLTATATADSLFKCRQWDYSNEVCFGEWVKLKDIIPGQQYEVVLTADDPGFIEGDSNITLNITPINITNITIELVNDIPNITIAVNKNATLDLSAYFSNLDESTTFTYYKPDKISIVFENNIATIVPDKEFIGIGFTYITADKLVASNVFSVNAVNATNVTVDVTPEITLNKKDFGLDEDVELGFEYLKKQELVDGNKWKDEYEVYEEETEKTEEELKLLQEKIIKKEIQYKKWQKASESIEALVYDNEGNAKDINVEIGELREGKFDIKNRLDKRRHCLHSRTGLYMGSIGN